MYTYATGSPGTTGAAPVLTASDPEAPTPAEQGGVVETIATPRNTLVGVAIVVGLAWFFLRKPGRRRR